MRYVLLIYRSEADSASMTQQELAELMQGHALFAREALARGILTGGEPLQPTSSLYRSDQQPVQSANRTYPYLEHAARAT